MKIRLDSIKQAIISIFPQTNYLRCNELATTRRYTVVTIVIEITLYMSSSASLEYAANVKLVQL